MISQLDDERVWISDVYIVHVVKIAERVYLTRMEIVSSHPAPLRIVLNSTNHYFQKSRMRPHDIGGIMVNIFLL